MTDPTQSQINWGASKPTLMLGGAWAVIPALAGFTLIARLDLAAHWLDSLGPWAVVVYVAIFALTSGLGLLPTYAQALAGGWIFGLETGTIAALAGFSGGAVIGRIVSARLARTGLDDIFSQSAKAQAVRDALLHRSAWGTTGVITLLRLPPNSPFALMNLALTACRAAWVPYIVGTAVGMTPRTAIVVGLGAAGAATGAQSLGAMIEDGTQRWYLIGGIVAVVIVLAILARIGQNAIARLSTTSSTSR